MRELLGAAVLLLAATGATMADGPPVTAAELNRLRAAIMPCWRERRPGDRAAGQVAIHVCLDQAGQVESAEIVHDGPPADAWLTEMEQRARRALLRCQPYPMPAGGPRPYCFTGAFQLPPH